MIGAQEGEGGTLQDALYVGYALVGVSMEVHKCNLYRIVSHGLSEPLAGNGEGALRRLDDGRALSIDPHGPGQKCLGFARDLAATAPVAPVVGSFPRHVTTFLGL